MGNGKRKSMSFIAISLLLIFFLSGIYFIYTLVHNWDEFREPIALYTIETEEHKYYVRNNAIYDESGKKIEELTQIYLSLLNKKNNKQDTLYFENQEEYEAYNKKIQMFKNCFEDKNVINPRHKIQVINTSRRVSVSRWRDAGDWNDDDDYEIEIPHQTIIITR